MLYKVCPKNSEHKTFHARATVRQLWLVTETGSFLEMIDGEDAVVARPNAGDDWKCAECGAAAVTRDSEHDEVRRQQYQMASELHGELKSFLEDAASGKFVKGQMEKARALLERLEGVKDGRREQD